MFEFFFKYPLSVFSKGTFVLAGSMADMALVGGYPRGGDLAWFHGVRDSAGSSRMAGFRSAVGLASADALARVVLLMLWHPALSVATLRPQQNIVAVVVDDSGSMGRRMTKAALRAAMLRSTCSIPASSIT